MESKKNGGYVGRCYRTFCIILFNKKNLKRDIAILGSFVLILLMVWFADNRIFTKVPLRDDLVSQQVLGQESGPKTEEEAVAQEEKTVIDVINKIDVSSWTPYQNTWYGFALKYPNLWGDPTAKKALVGVLWDQKVEFRTKNMDEKNPFEGFDITVYNVAKARELSATEEFPKLKTQEFANEDKCKTIEGHLLETGDYPAEEIYIPSNDACYNSALFFSNTRGAYIYNLTPKLKEGWGLAGDPAEELKSHMPEFFAVASTLDLIDIVRPKPAPPKPKITAPKPASYKILGGKMVCDKRNDKPSKSDKNKGKHLDMECCLDPDEYPNPWCSYDPGKYGKYLK